MYYSHDTFGLGHLRRTLTLAKHFGAAAPGISQLVVSGSPSAHLFELPENTDIIKLPSVTKDHEGKYVPRSLDIGLESVRNTRRDILKSAAQHFQPDVFVVDHAPAGMRGEVIATLKFLREHSPQTRLVVGLRDIMDEPSVVRQQWARDGVYDLLNEFYDRILIYGNQDIFDVVEEYGLSPKAAAKTDFVGYLGREAGKTSPADVRANLGMKTDKLVLVTAGGGGDGHAIFESTLRDLELDGGATDMDVLIVGGSLLDNEDRAAFRERADALPNVHRISFTDDLDSLIGAADVVVSMGGYNTVSEILALGGKGIVVPRTTPRKEQLIRAQLMSERGYVSMIRPEDLFPGALLSEVRRQLSQPDRPAPRIEMNGLDNVVRSIDALWLPPSTASA